MKKRLLSFLLAAVMIWSLYVPGIPEVQAAYDMEVSDNCVELIKAFEGFKEKAEYDYGQYTIGYGTACKFNDYPNGITRTQADKLLRDDLKEFETDLNKFAKKYSLTLSQQQFDALISFTYNLGSNWMNNTSTFRTAVINGAKGNDFIFAISRWCNAGDTIVPGLVQRRLAEANLYLNGIYSKDPPANYRYVLFDGNITDAVLTVKIQGYDANQTDGIRAEPSKAGYRFLGWYSKATGGEWVTKLDADTDSVLYAHWQSVSAPDPKGVAASYVRYAGTDQPLYDNPGGAQIKELSSGKKLSITADYMDNEGVKWGKISEGWVKLSQTKDAEASTPGQAVNLKVVVTTDGVNIRKGPGTSYPKVGKANKGQELHLTRVRQGGIYQWGQFSGGWICLDYTDYELAVLEDSGSSDSTPVTGVVVKADKLNIRSRPTTSSTKVGQYSKGDKVTITQQQKVGSTTWGKTDKGWISLYYVDLTSAGNSGTGTGNTDTQNPGNQGNTGTQNPGDQSSSGTGTTTVIATGKIAGCTSLRIRAGAGTGYAQVGSLAKGTQVNFYEMKTVGSQIWGRMNKGWVCMTYVKLDTSDSGSSDSTLATGTIVNCEKLNVRAGAGTAYAKVGTIAKGTKVEILETTKVGKVTWGRTDKGWISLFYVRLDSQLPESGESTQNPSEGSGTTTPSDPGSGGTGTGDNTGNTGTGDSQQGTTQQTKQTGVITGTTELRVRSAPGTNSKQVGTLKKGDRVIILETVKVGTATWGHIDSGWIHMFYVKLDSEEVPEGAIVGTVTANVRIRAGAGTNYDAVGTYLRGTQIVITAQTTVNGAVWGRTDKGWVHMYYVK